MSKPFTGKTILLWFIGFFLVIFAVNGTMAWLALDSWSGPAAEHPYRQGITYNEEIEQAEMQKKSGWKLHVSGQLKKQSGSLLELSLLHPANTSAPQAVIIHFRRPVVQGYDFDLSLPMSGTRDGHVIYSSTVDLPLPGVWEMAAIAKSGDETKYKLTDRFVVSK